MQISDTDPLLYRFEDDGKSLTKAKGYWFPYKFKYFAWFLVLAIIVASSVFLILYGLTFGLIKCYLWVTAVAISILIGLLVIQPVKILIFSYILSLIMKSPPSLQLKKIPKNILDNSYDEKKAFKAYKIRVDYTPYYVPLPKFRLENRAENIKFHLEQRRLCVEVLVFFVFVLVLSYVVIVHKSWAGYHSTQVVKHLTVHASYTDTIPFTQVTSYREFLEYLNSTLLPSLFGRVERYEGGRPETVYRIPDKTGSARNAIIPKGRKRSPGGYFTKLGSGEERRSEAEKRAFEIKQKILRFESESQKNITKIYDRSWTLDRSVKIIGKPRMRQLRVKNNTCAGIPEIKTREKMCFAELTGYNEETGDFSLWWADIEDEVLTPKEQKPWNYSSGWETGAIRLSGRYSSYPAGGYVLELAKNLEDSRLIIDFMDAFQWIDARTRAVIIEFTLYSVNVNLFNVVYLIAERSASGYFITSYQIDTAKFMFLANELEAISVVMIVAFNILLLLFLYRQAIRIERTSFKSYFTRGSPAVDILIIFLGLISVLFIFLRSLYVGSLMDKLDHSQNYEYVSFSYAAVWDNISTYMNAVLVILAALKLFQILRFRVLFLQLQETLRGSSRYFLTLTFQLLVVVIGFAFLFYLALVPYSRDFGTFGLSLSTLIGLALSLDENYDYSVLANTPWFIAPLFFVFFIVLTTLLILNFFVSIICFYLGRVKNTSIENKYNAVAYLKYLLTASDKTDILRLKGGCSPSESPEEIHPIPPIPPVPPFPPLRLRGGSEANTETGTSNRKKYPFPPDYVTEKKLIKRTIPSFAKAKIYDFNNYFRFRLSNRFQAMKNITRAELEKDDGAKIRDRETAMSALVASKLHPGNENEPDKYYTIVNGPDKTVVSSVTLAKMKKMVDDYGRKRLIEKYKKVGVDLNIIEDEVVDYTETIRILDKKFTRLGAVVHKKYKEEKRNAFGIPETDETQVRRKDQSKKKTEKTKPPRKNKKNPDKKVAAQKEKVERKPLADENVERKPVADKTVERKPLADEKVERKPMGGEKVGGTPVAHKKVKKKPLAEEKVERKPMGDEKVERKPIGDEEVERKPMGDEKVGGTPMGDEKVERKPTGDEKVGGEPVAHKKVKKKPVADEKVGGTPVGDEKMERKPVADEKVERKPVGDEKVERKPTGDEKVGGTPVGDEKVERKPTGDEKVGGTPVGNEKVERKPVGDEKVGGEPVAHKKVKKKPVADEKVGGTPMGDEKVERKPTGDEKVERKPTGDEKVGVTPVGDEKVQKKPVADEKVEVTPVGDEKVERKPTGDEKVGGEPVAHKKVKKKPVADENVEGKPVGDEKVEGEPVAHKKVKRNTVADEKVEGQPLGDEKVGGTPAEDKTAKKPKEKNPEGRPKSTRVQTGQEEPEKKTVTGDEITKTEKEKTV